jgi:hypothetical protein
MLIDNANVKHRVCGFLCITEYDGWSPLLLISDKKREHTENVYKKRTTCRKTH